MESILTTKEVAEQLGYSQQYVRKLLRNGRLPGYKLGKAWAIPASDLEELDDKKALLDSKLSDKNRVASKSSKPIALSFFSGAMGLDLGLERAGFEVILTSEIDKACKLTIKQNRPDVAIIGDVRDYSAQQVKDAAGLQPGDEIDLIAGGPPCQAFSTAGKRLGFDDERGNVFLNFIELILDLKPKYAVIENVRGLLSAPLRHRPHSERGYGQPPLAGEELAGGALLHILRMLRDGGYFVSFNLYNAANYGSPQTRERVVIICSRENSRVPYLKPTNSSVEEFGLQPHKTLKEALKGLENVHHDHVNFSKTRLSYYKLLGPGQNWRNLPENLQMKAMGKSYYSGGGKTGFYRRLSWDKPSPTLVTHPAMPATDLAHPEEDRPLSVQEYKRIQEFPDNWEICGTMIEQYRQIGNAVPSSLGFAIGCALLSHMKGEKISELKDFRYSRYRNTDDSAWEQDTRARIESGKQTLLELR